MRKILLPFLICFFAINIKALPGDTIKVQAHQNEHWSWNGAIDKWVVFPQNKTYRKVLLKYTLGCPSTGCSEWDYTTQIKARKRGGGFFEIARIITPYAGNFPSNWRYTWTFDVTDYAAILEDSVEIRAFYGGWQDGFTITLDFEMIEGTPPRPVLQIEEVYSSGPGGFKYGISGNSIENHLTPKSISVHSNTKSAKFKVTQSGHSFGGNLNCAEFCNKKYYLLVNGQQRFSQEVWRDDCGLNPVFPQAGTWLYDRSAWCPGEKTLTFEHDISPYLNPGVSNSVEMNMDSYTYSGGAGFDPNYIIEAHLVTYGDAAFNNDVSIEAIKKPSKEADFSRFNPICGAPEIIIRNTGKNDLTSVKISYGMDGAAMQQYTWTGNLKFMQKETVVLPALNSISNGRFKVIVSNPNNTQDEYALNNTIYSEVETVPDYDGKFVVVLLTNAAPHENAYKIYDHTGTEVYGKSGFSPFSFVRDTVDLPKGCYEFVFTDSDKDGLSFFANNDGGGTLSFWKMGGVTLKTFPSDFGTELRHQFTVGGGVGINEKVAVLKMNIFPNPSSGIINISNEINDEALVTIFDMLGREIYTGSFIHNTSVDLSEEGKGVYFIVVEQNNQRISKKVMIY